MKIKPFIIRDACKNFWDGHVFYNKKEAIEALVSFHTVDWNDEEEGSDLENWIQTQLTDNTSRLNFLLEHGQWEIEYI